MNKIDEQEYEQGKLAFNHGMELKDVVRRVLGEPDEDKALSHVLGYLGAALEKIRKLP